MNRAVATLPAHSDLLSEPYQDGPLSQQVDRAIETVLARGKGSRAAMWLRSVGLWPNETERILRGGFRCSKIDATVTARCQIESCRYHIRYQWSANCLLAYMQQQNIDALSIDEISFLYRIPVDNVKCSIDRSTAQLRAQAIDVQAQYDEWLTPQFSFLLSRQVCVVCESTLDPNEPLNRSLTIESIGAAYCSKECREAKPPRIIELEVEKRLPIERILEWTFRHYKSLALAEQALNMPRWLMYEACRRYLGKPLDSFFDGLRAVQTQRKSALIRRTWHAPAWVDGLVEQLLPVRQAVMHKFGPPSHSLTRYRKRLAEVLTSV